EDPSADDGRAVYAGDAEQDVGSLVKDEVADVPESAERGRERLLLVPEPVAYRAGPSERLEERVERLRRRSRPCGPKAQCGAPEPVHEDVRLDVSREAIYCARLLAFSRRPHAATVLAFAISSSSGGRPGRGLAGALSIQLGLTPHKFSPSLVLLQRARVVLLIARPETGDHDDADPSEEETPKPAVVAILARAELVGGVDGARPTEEQEQKKHHRPPS